MKRLMGDFPKQFARRFLDFFSWDPWSFRSWSQEGEDMLLRRLFEYKADGFFVDVGAHHPKRFSNTYLLYRKGWSGINIDAMPDSMSHFKKLRPRDINLEIGVAKTAGTHDYYIFNESALNGFSASLSRQREGEDNNYRIERVVPVEVKPLSDILDKYLNARKIDFLTVDVEGLDLEVLESNDWKKYRPQYVLVEILESVIGTIEDNPVTQFMRHQGYAVFAKQVNTVFFRDEQRK